MKKKFLSVILSLMLCLLLLPMAAFAEDYTDLSKTVRQHYRNNDYEFIKISHPDKPSNKRRSKQKYADGLLDYLGGGKLGVPYVDDGADGQGDRGQTYSWTGISYGDWLYVSTQFSSMMSARDVLPVIGHNFEKEVMNTLLDAFYRGDLFVAEEDGEDPGSTLCKINVKTGEVKVLMSKEKNGMSAMFRNSVEYKGKLYFCGGINMTPCIYEVDPETDNFRCVYQDLSMIEDPYGYYEAFMIKKINPGIRGLTVFRDYLVVSFVDLDGNPYIAVSDNPSGNDSFHKIAYTYKKGTEEPGELFGYPACRLTDSIFGGSIWEMVTFNDKLYVAACTGTPENTPDDQSMQSFAIICGECEGEPDDPESWTWRPVVGDKEDGAKYTFGIDPERTRSGACNLAVFKDHLYIGEYNDTEIAGIRFLFDMDAEFLAENLEQSVSLYRMDKNENIEKVMGNPTRMFPESLSGMRSGFGTKGKPVYENQYIWQSHVFNNKLYFGTLDESSFLYPLASISNGDLLKLTPREWKLQLKYLKAAVAKLIEDAKREDVSAPPEHNDDSGTVEETPDGSDQNNAPDEGNAPDETQPGNGPVQDPTGGELEALTQIRKAQNDTEAFLKKAGKDFDMNSFPRMLDNKADIDSLYKFQQMATMIPNMLEQDEDWTLEEKIKAKESFFKIYKAMYDYFQETGDIPDPICDFYKKLFNEENYRKLKNMIRCLYYLKNSEGGFDLFVTEDGEHFDCITRNGLGDPYNHGSRVFAANHSRENPWMCIGTANPFYGTQIWRMEGEGLNLPPVIPGGTTDPGTTDPGTTDPGTTDPGTPEHGPGTTDPGTPEYGPGEAGRTASQTGDGSNIMIWTLLGTLSLLGIVSMRLVKKSRNEAR